MKGRFIVFEGIDGSGKSSHCALLKKRLEEDGYKVYLTCEPSQGEAGKLLRKCLKGEQDMDERAIAGLFMTDRLDHITNADFGILSHLEKGEIVLCDRYYFSSFAYNSISSPMDWVIAINEQARKLLKADLTLFLDIPPEVFSKRIANRNATERYEKIEVLRKVRDNYLSAFEKVGDENIQIIDNSVPFDVAADNLWNAVQATLAK